MKFIEPNWPQPKQVRAFTTTRQGWGGRNPHHNDNQGNFTAANTSYASESRRLEELLQLPQEPTWVKQTHSTIVLEADPKNTEQLADASFTRIPQHICIINTADCLPLLICNQAGTEVAAIHAGWRGLANGIIETTFCALLSAREDLMVWLGPAIGPQKFEVGKDVYEAFTSQYAEAKTAFTPHTEGKWLANLYQLAEQRLHLLGIQQIYGGNYCTYSQEELFFSYRRDHGKTGRMASVIWIDKN